MLQLLNLEVNRIIPPYRWLTLGIEHNGWLLAWVLKEVVGNRVSIGLPREAFAKGASNSRAHDSELTVAWIEQHPPTRTGHCSDNKRARRFRF